MARRALNGEGGDLFGGGTSLKVPGGGGQDTHPDLLVVERTVDERTKRLRNEVVIADVRRATDFFALTAFAGGWRVVIVDAADELNRNAANALLKLVEEPPHRGLVLLIAHRPGLVLPTLTSRCRRLPLRPLSADQLTLVLRSRIPGIAEDEAAGLAALAEGSPGRALRLAAVDGLAMYAELTALLDGLPAMNVEAQHKLADRVARRSADEAYRALGELLSGWLARLIRAGAGRPDGSGPTGEEARYAGLLPRRSLDQWVGLWEKVTVALARGQEFNLDRKQVVLNLFSTLQVAVSG